MNYPEFEIIGTYQGKIKEFGAAGERSAIVKDAINGPVFVSKQQFGSDEIADLKHHGGEWRVVHQLPQEHYTYWQKMFPQSASYLSAGTYGENICTRGVSESDICVGDILEVGECRLQVSEPRRPCGTLNIRYQNNQFLNKLIETTNYGWFYRVLRAGEICTGQRAKIVERPHPDLSLALIISSVFLSPANKEICQKLVNCQELSPKWREYALKALEKHTS